MMGNQSNRFISLDIFRGIAITAMLIVNNQGDWPHVYPVLRHASWHGWSGADIVFPLFLFALGASVSFSISKKLDIGILHKEIYLKIIRRTFILILMGLFLNLFPEFKLTGMRIPGVLQRIALCYLFSSAIYLFFNAKLQYGIAIFLLAFYWLCLKFLPLDGVTTGSLEPAGNLCRYIDNFLFNGHTYRHAAAPGFDPEGLFSTIPAISSTLAGVFAAELLLSQKSHTRKTIELFAAANTGIILGLMTNMWIPINKNLWTPSYAVFMCGVSLYLLLLCFRMVDINGCKLFSKPFLILGANPITLYFLSTLFAKLTVYIKILQSDGNAISIKAIIYKSCFASWANGYNASLFYSIAFLSFWLVIMYLLYKKNLFIRI
jgi:predicted acyltransferase